MCTSQRLSRITIAALVAAAGAGTGCGAGVSYAYSPEHATGWANGYPATTTPVPPERPQGNVDIASFGFTTLASGSQEVPVLHVRMTVDNEGDATPWSVDTRTPAIEIAGEGQAHALYVNTDVATLPLVSIAQHERKTLDFYFPVPATMDDDEALVGFDFLWQVTTPDRQVSDRTRFGRIELDTEPEPTTVVLVAGWGPMWWYDPLFPRPVFVHPPRLFHPHGHGRVIITRPPRGHVIIRDHRR